MIQTNQTSITVAILLLDNFMIVVPIVGVMTSARNVRRVKKERANDRISNYSFNAFRYVLVLCVSDFKVRRKRNERCGDMIVRPAPQKPFLMEVNR